MSASGSDLVAGLAGVASGGAGKALWDYLRARQRQPVTDQLDRLDLSTRYWQRITALEQRVEELTTLNLELVNELARRDREIGELRAHLAALEQRLAPRFGATRGA